MDNFNERRETGSQPDDFKVNAFASEQSSNNPMDLTGQGQFPQFGEGANFEDIQARIETAKSNGWGSQLARFIGSNKKRILVLAAIIALFAASSYMSDKANQNLPEEEQSAGIAGISQNTPDILGDGDEEGNKQISEEDEGNQIQGPKPLNIKLGERGEVIINDKEEQSNDAGQLLSQADGVENVAVSADAITVSAQRGDGITHLARRAITEYLQNSGKTLSAEQKVYAEDYVQNKTGSEMLEIGQKLSFSNDLLKEALEKAEVLEAWQIENLKQYIQAVSL